jgi:protein SCO1/2
MKTIRYIAWAAVILVLAVLAYTLLAGESGRQLLRIADADIGGPFDLVRADGTRITDRDLAGHPYAIFFGFTHCPEVCPTTLYEAGGWLEQLGEEDSGFRFYFVTVDPARDTPEVLSEYMTSFPKITGITGDEAGIEQIKKEYKVFAQKVPLEDGDYTMDHTATVYLMDGDGHFFGTIAWREDSDTAVAKIRRLIEKG